MLKHVAELYGIIFSMLLVLNFSLILHVCISCQYELVFSKWPTIRENLAWVPHTIRRKYDF